MMAAAHVTARLAGFLLGDCHDPLSSQKNSGGTKAANGRVDIQNPAG
jgi:hypothetical protein